MPRRNDLTMFREAAEDLGITRQTVGDLVRALGIEAKDMGLAGGAKGLDREDMALLRKALSVGQKRQAASST
jgi:hypothetical protein